MRILRRIWKDRHLIRIVLVHPSRAVNSFLAVLSYKLKLIRPLGKPIAVDLEPANFCNLHCPHCQVTHWDKPKSILTLDKFKSWIKHFSRSSRIKLQGMGEPFLNRELPAIIGELEKHGVYVEIVSNGTILTDHIRAVLTRSRNLSIAISFDGADKETFERVRRGSNFEKIKENVSLLAHSKPLKSKLSVCMVAFEEHKNQIKPTIELVRNLGVKNFILQLILINYGQDKLNSKTVERRINVSQPNDKVTMIGEVQQVAQINGVNVNVEGELFDEKNQCPWPWLGTYIDTEGNVIPCCRVANASVCNFGNLNKQDFHTIWHSKGYRMIREQIRTNNIPEFCRSCYKPHIAEKAGKDRPSQLSKG